jgi:hypothetical protein
MMTSNMLPRFKNLDYGVDRRYIIYRCKNKFLESHETITDSSFQYLKNQAFFPTNWSDHMKNACLFYFARYCRRFYTGCAYDNLKDGMGIVAGVSKYYNVPKFLLTFFYHKHLATITLDNMVTFCVKMVPCYFQNDVMDARQRSAFVTEIVKASGNKIIFSTERNVFINVAFNDWALTFTSQYPWCDLSNFNNNTAIATEVDEETIAI